MTRERLVGVCLLGVLLFSPVIIHIFDLGATVQVFGIPVLLIYLFGSWALLIALAALLIFYRHAQIRKLDLNPDEEEDL